MNENIIAKISAVVEIEINKDELDINKLDKKIYKASCKAGREVFQESLNVIEKYLLNEKRDKNEVVIHSHKKGNIETLVGAVRYNYTQVKDKSKKTGRKYYSLLKNYMGIENHQVISNNVKVKGILKAGEVPYRLASESLDNQVSHSSIRNWSIEMGKEIEKKEEDYIGEKYKVLDNRGNQAFVESDGIMIKMQEGKGKKSEIKLAICYSGREDRYKKSESGQKKLKDKVVYGDICKSEEFIEKASLFFNYFCNLLSVMYIVILGDGALWIKGFLSVYKWAVYQLDRYHLLEKIRKHFSRKQDEYEEIKKLIEENKIEEVMRKIKEKICFLQGKLSEYNRRMTEEKVEEEKARYKNGISRYEKKITRVENLLTYIKNNKDGINGIDKYKDIFSEDDLVIGSGGIENSVKNIIGKRMKGQGKCWKTQGARAMVKILVSLSNGWYSFEDYLNIFSKKEKPLELSKKPKEKRIISKGKREAYQMEQIYRGNIPSFSPTSSPMGYFKKGLLAIDCLDILHIN
jgi:hypothetical protein